VYIPLITAKPSLAPFKVRAGNAVGSPLLHRNMVRYGPVTTEPFGVRLRSCHIHDLASMMWQIYGRGNTRALCDKSMFRRTSPGT